MSLDFNSHPLYPQQDLDPYSLHNPDPSTSSPTQTRLVQPHSYDHVESMDVSDSPGYNLFPNNSPQPSFGSQRYRTNASSSSSLGVNYPMNNEPVYPQSSFGDSVPSFNGTNGIPYDMMESNAPSSFGNSKASPLSPSDQVGSISHTSTFHPLNGPTKDYPQHGYSDLAPPQRRYSNASAGPYQSEYQDNYGVGSGGGVPYPSTAMPQFPERLGNFQPNGRFQHSGTVPTVPSHVSPHGPDIMHGVAPQATHGGYRSDVSGYDDPSRYLGPNPHSDMSLRMPNADESLVRVKLQSVNMGSSDLNTFIRPYIDQYVRTPNRLAFGERTVIVMSSKVAQKSYGTEKRFLCPPPTAIMIGNSWWSDVRRGEESKLCPPRVVVSISGEPAPQEGSIEWTMSSGKSFDVNDPPAGTTYIGRCVGKQLFISDVDEKKKKVEALVRITAPTSDGEPERVIGTFPSRPIKVISKPSKKRQSAKNLELCINHGSTLSLFHRLRSQTVSTKYLCVSGSGSSFKGSDGAPLMGLDQRSRSATPSFIARTASWDPFVMYIVDVHKPAGGIDAPPPPPPQPEYPSPPPNAIPFTNNGSLIPIYYNQTVVLQCLTSGVVSPVLIIRKVDHQTTVVGGGLQDGAKGVVEQYCPPGEVCGDPVSQLHKIAFEVYDASKGLPEPGTPGNTGAFLSCMGEKVNTYRPIEGRQWSQSFNVRSGSPEPSGSPTGSTPVSASSTPNDFFGQNDSAPASPSPTNEYMSHDGGRVKKKRSSSSAGAGGIGKPANAKGRRRPNSTGSAGSSRRGSSSEAGASSGALWQVDIGETSVWTIVGTDQVRYNFYVPPVLFDNQNAPQTRSFPIPSKQVTPFPAMMKYLPPDRAAEAPKSNCASSRAMMAKPSPHAAKMLTIYGENFSKTEPLSVFFGSDPSPYVEIRCTEVLGCLPPETLTQKPRPMILVRQDGIIFPSNVMFP